MDKISKENLEVLTKAFKEVLPTFISMGALCWILEGQNIEEYIATVEENLKNNNLLK